MTYDPEHPTINPDTFDPKPIGQIGIAHVVDLDGTVVTIVTNGKPFDPVDGTRWMKFNGGYLTETVDEPGAAAAVQAVRDKFGS